MSVPTLRHPGTPASAGPADNQVTTPDVFRRQTLLLAVATPLCALSMLVAAHPPDALFWVGAGALVALTILTALPVAPGATPGWLALPLLADIPVVATLGADDPSLSTWVVLVLICAWVGRSYGRHLAGWSLALTAASLAGAAAWAYEVRGLDAEQVVGVAAAVLVVATIVTALTAHSRDTLQAQAGLLQRQAEMLESALDRARGRSRDVQQVLDTVDFAIITIAPGDPTLELNVTARRLLERLEIPTTVRLDQLPLYAIDGTTPLETHGFAALLKEIQDDHGAELPVWLGHPGAARVALSLTANTVELPGAGATRTVVAARDITEERAAIAARDDMIASLSHELRTPLSSIIGYVELVQEDPELPELHRSSLDVALKNSDRVLRLVADLAQTRANEATPGFTVTLSECDVAAVLADSLDSVRPLASDRLLSVTVDAPPSLMICGDPYRLRNVVDNLLSNAVKYNEIGGWIDVVLAAEPRGHVTLMVANTGPTLAPEEVARLFERFYRPPSSRNSTVHGTGIGLSVAREIVELHGGTIDADSSADSGTTTFTVVLPMGSEDAGEVT